MGSDPGREVHEGCSPRSAAPDATPASLLLNSRREILRSMRYLASLTLVALISTAVFNANAEPESAQAVCWAGLRLL